MPFSKFIVFPIFVALQAAIMMLIAPFFKVGPETIGGVLLTWVAFQAWAMYFLGGCTIKAAGKTVVGYAGGIIASVAIFELMGVFGKMGVWGGALAVFIVVIPVMCAERVAILNFIPAWFLGAGVFFALAAMHGPSTIGGYIEIAVPEMIACVVGLVFGYCTVTFRTWYEKMVMPSVKEAGEETVEKVEQSA
ncbi:MAG: DUF1097 domain-containing protein [Planctomycetes bacterium]|nr:DUF1097 domain-containing protein [Planctomycetota bacterium]